MKKKYLLIVCIAAILLVSASIIGKRKAEGVIITTLKDGEVKNLDYTVLIKNAIGLKDFQFSDRAKILNSAILKSYQVSGDEINGLLICYFNHICNNRHLDYTSTAPYILENELFRCGIPYGKHRITSMRYAAIDCLKNASWERADKKSEEVEYFYKALFTSKAARAFLVDAAIKYTVEICKSYPKDYKPLLLKEIDNLLIFSNKLKTLNPRTNSDNLNDYWEGFIFRRYLFDGVSISEIQSSLNKMKAQIQAVNVSENADARIEVKINEQISLFIGSGKYYLYSESSKKEINISMDELKIEEVKYIKDDSNDYYLFTGTVKNEKNLSFRITYDKNLNKID